MFTMSCRAFTWSLNFLTHSSRRVSSSFMASFCFLTSIGLGQLCLQARDRAVVLRYFAGQSFGSDLHQLEITALADHSRFGRHSPLDAGGFHEIKHVHHPSHAQHAACRLCPSIREILLGLWGFRT